MSGCFYLKLECSAGTDIETACNEAVSLANRIGINVEFKFNNVYCFAWPGSDPKLLTDNWRQVVDSDKSHKIAVPR